KTPSCRQRSLRGEELDGQIDQLLATITISDTLKEWAIKALHEEQQKASDLEESIDETLQRRRTEIKRRLEHINGLILSPDTDWTLISPQEVKQEKTRLAEDLQRLEEHLAPGGERQHDYLELSAKTLQFAAYARFWFKEGDLDQRRAIFGALGSNPVLKERK